MKIYQVDAFTDHVFGGNPAAICPLEKWIPVSEMQNIAMENNLSETAFFVKEKDHFFIRWFTPEMEIDLCGHATLASAHVIFNYLDHNQKSIDFKYGGGNLSVSKHGELLSMDFPSVTSEKVEINDQLSIGLGKQPLALYKARDLMAIFDSEEEVVSLKPNFSKLAEIDSLGIIVTSPGNDVDFVSRFFAPSAGINEDPVTGSAHCMLIPYWAKQLNKNKLNAKQLSNRLGELSCEYNGDRVQIGGKAITYMIGEIEK